MRFLAAVFCAVLVCAKPLGGQTDTDPYCVQFVRNNLQTTQAHVGLWSSAAKDFPRLGDGVSIALLKILEAQDLKDPNTIQASLLLIRRSFSYPPGISMNINRKPKVTLFLLRYWRQNIADAQTQRDLEETIDYVQRQTSSPTPGNPGV